MNTEQKTPELKPQDMISGEWYKVDAQGQLYLIKFSAIDKSKINDIEYSLLYNFEEKVIIKKDIMTSRHTKFYKATREEVLEHFPDEFKEEKKEVESELKEGEEFYFYVKSAQFEKTTNLQEAIDEADGFTYIYSAKKIGTKQTKSILEPIKTK
jgi:hypothetical protein